MEALGPFEVDFNLQMGQDAKVLLQHNLTAKAQPYPALILNWKAPVIDCHSPKKDSFQVMNSYQAEIEILGEPALRRDVRTG